MTLKQVDRYEIKQEIGRGGMAAVYLAHDPRFGRDVAVKVLPEAFLHDPMFQTRFEREARMIAQLEHSAIVPVYDFGEYNGQPFLVMRYMPGGTLSRRIMNGPLSLEEAAPIVVRIANALDYSHHRGVIHRDLKPGNILFDGQGDAFLSDYGIAKLLQATTTFTGSAIIGTPAYMSPEQVHGEKDIDGRSDIYTLGVIIFEMLTGHIPYPGDTPARMLMAHVLNPVPRILEYRKDLPSSCDTIISKAMAKDREKRYATASKFAEDIQKASRGVFIQPAVTPDAGLTTQMEPGQVDKATPFRLTPAGTEVLDDSEQPLLAAVPPPEPDKTSSPARKIPIWLWGLLGAIIIGGLIWGSIIFFGGGDGSDETPIASLLTEPATPLVLQTATSPTTETATKIPSSTPIKMPTETPSRTPSPTNTALPTMPPDFTVIITLSSVNVRSGPGTIYPVIGRLFEDDEVEVIAISPDRRWLNIVMPDASTGWVSITVVAPAPTTNITAIPTAVTIPAPPTIPPYGSGSVNWVDPFQDAANSRQAANDKIVRPLAFVSSFLVLLMWLILFIKNGTFRKRRLVQPQTSSLFQADFE